MVVSNFLELFFSDEVLFLNFEKGFVKCSEVGCIDNGPKMAKIKIELCYFTYVFRGIIQGIE